MRAILDPNVIISALLSPAGTPARLVRAWQNGAFELIVSASLLSELERALAYPKLRQHVNPDQAADVVEWLNRAAAVAPDADRAAPVSSSDPGDDYLLALASQEGVALVSGDKHLLALKGECPVYSAAEFLTMIGGDH